jgi:hypothetical protein
MARASKTSSAQAGLKQKTGECSLDLSISLEAQPRTPPTLDKRHAIDHPEIGNTYPIIGDY